MSEQKKNKPEKWEAPEPWTANCGNKECSVDEYTRDSSNTAMVDYADKRECNFLYSQCPSCKHSLRVYIDNLDPEEANRRGYEIVDNERTPDDGIFEEWLGIKGAEVPKSYELTPRLETEVGSFATTLANCPDDLLYDSIVAANDRPHPERWTDGGEA